MFAIALPLPDKKRKRVTSAMANNRKRTMIRVDRSSEETLDSLMATVAQLRSELDVEKKCIRQLRREKAYEVQLAREQERNRASVSLKETAAKLHQEKEQEVETLRCRHKADVVKVLKLKDRELNNIRKDLAKCQDDLKEEVSKRGLSTSARAAFELERSKLLQEVKELNASKKQAENLLCSALEAEKQKTYDLRQLQVTSRIEVAKVNKEANTEMKRLLEELRAKDHQLAVLKGNHSITKSSTKHHPEYQHVSLSELLSLSRGTDSLEKKLPTNAEVSEVGNGPNLSLQRKYYELEKQLKHMVSVNYGFIEKNNEFLSINKALEERIDELVEEKSVLNVEVNSQKDEIRKLNDLLTSAGRKSLHTVNLGILKKQARDQKNAGSYQKKKSKRKKVRFLLPGEDHEVYAGDDGDGGAEDKGGGEGEGTEDEQEMMLLSTDSAFSKESNEASSYIHPATAGEIKEDLEQLVKKHMEMQKSYNMCLSNEKGQKESADSCIQRESLEIVIHTLEEKLQRCQEAEKLLKMKNKEVCDQNEELEFQILELENATDEKKLDWEKEKELLKSELSVLKCKPWRNAADDVMERNVAVQCDEVMIEQNVVEQESELKESLQHKSLAQKNISADAETVDDDMNGDAGDGLMALVGHRDREKMCYMSEIENLKRKLDQSRDRERQMREQLLLLEEEKNRQIKMLQQQMESLEGNDYLDTKSTLQVEDGMEFDRTGKPVGEIFPSGASDSFPVDEENNTKHIETKEKIIKLELYTNLNWVSSSSDIFSSTPTSGDYELGNCEEYKDSRKEQLYRQISDLERDRDVLQEIIHKDENVIQELQVEMMRLKQTENDLQRLVDELEMNEKWMNRKVDVMASRNHEMELEMQQLRTSESVLVSTVQKMKEVETDLRTRLEETLEEKQTSGNIWKRKLSEAELEKKVLQEKFKETEEQLGDLESSEIMLKQKLKRMERAESYLKNELADAKRECNIAVNHLSELESEKDALMQKLERAYLDFTAELVRLRQEQEAKTVEMIEISCKVKVLEQSLACREMTINTLESKLHDSELREKELLRKILASESVSYLMPYGMTEIPLWHLIKDGNFIFQSSNMQNSCCHHANEDACKRIQQNNWDRCAYDGLPVNDELKEDGSKEFLSVASSSGVAPTEDVESADEASEIIDEDDGAAVLNESLSGSNSWHHLVHDPDSAPLHLSLPAISVSVSSLDSISDSGLESLQHDRITDLNHQKTNHQESFTLVVRPNAYMFSHQTEKKSLIPISIRYLTNCSICQPEIQNLALIPDVISVADENEIIGTLRN